jgi:hypothetical protein
MRNEFEKRMELQQHFPSQETPINVPHSKLSLREIGTPSCASPTSNHRPDKVCCSTWHGSICCTFLSSRLSHPWWYQRMKHSLHSAILVSRHLINGTFPASVSSNLRPSAGRQLCHRNTTGVWLPMLAGTEGVSRIAAEERKGERTSHANRNLVCQTGGGCFVCPSSTQGIPAMTSVDATKM